jgi:hypothetical protein
MMPIPHAFNLLGWVAACGSLVGVALLTYWTNAVMVQVRRGAQAAAVTLACMMAAGM